MFLSKLLHRPIPKETDILIRDLTLDSRKVVPGTAFVALKGKQRDGQSFISNAIAKGAVAILVEAVNNNIEITFKEKVPVIPVVDLESKLSLLAAEFYGNPGNKLRVIGVTGTSGKTSCTHYIAQILTALGTRCGIIGTLGSGFPDQLSEVGLTTPDTISLQKTLRLLVDQGAKAVAMEVSSHSIDQGRINGIDFDIAIFTNLTQDHLDYHENMENYAQTKKRFLTDFPHQYVIINADDPYGRQWINEIKDKETYGFTINKPVPTYEKMGLGGISKEAISSRFTYTEKVQLSLKGIQAEVISPWGKANATIPLVGVFNLSNALAVISALTLFGISFKACIEQLAHLKPVDGRMQSLGGGKVPLVIVDYAHKPDALHKVLQTLRLHTKGYLYCVFGCGGERDHSKRPVMAKIAEHIADKVIITNDNPRHEKPEDIIKEIMTGFAHPENVIVEPDRSKAIEKSIQLAKAHDCILIAGKGAEHYQEIGDEKRPFDDVEQVKKYLGHLKVVT